MPVAGPSPHGNLVFCYRFRGPGGPLLLELRDPGVSVDVRGEKQVLAGSAVELLWKLLPNSETPWSPTRVQAVQEPSIALLGHGRPSTRPDARPDSARCSLSWHAIDAGSTSSRKTGGETFRRLRTAEATRAGTLRSLVIDSGTPPRRGSHRAEGELFPASWGECAAHGTLDAELVVQGDTGRRVSRRRSARQRRPDPTV